MKYTIYYKDKWEKCYKKIMLILCFSHHTIYLIVFLSWSRIIKGECSLEEYLVYLLFIMSSFLLCWNTLIVFLGKEDWYLDDKIVSLKCSIFDINFKNRQWEVAKIIEAKFVFTPRVIPSGFNKILSYGCHNSAEGPHYEIYFSLRNPQKFERVFWSGRPGLAEKLYSHIKLILDNKPKNIQLDFDKYDFFD